MYELMYENYSHVCKSGKLFTTGCRLPHKATNFGTLLLSGLVSSKRLHWRSQGGQPGHGPPKPRKGGIIKLPKSYFFESEFGSIKKKKIVGQIRGVFSFGGTLSWDRQWTVAPPPPPKMAGWIRPCSRSAESARNPIAAHVKFDDDCANAQPGLSQWTLESILYFVA